MNKEDVLRLLENNKILFEGLDEKLKNDFDVALLAFQKDEFVFRIAPILQNNRDIVLSAVTCSGSLLEYANEQFANDKEIVIAAIQSYLNAILYISEDLKQDKEVIKCAIDNGYNLFQQMGYRTLRMQKTILENRDLLLYCIKENPHNYGSVTGSFKDDEEIAWEAVKQVPMLFVKVGEQLKNNKDFLMKVLDVDVDHFASFKKEMRMDVDIAEKAISKSPAMLIYTNKENWTKEKIMDAAYVDQTILSSDHQIVKELLADREYIEMMLRKKPSIYIFLGKEMMLDKELALIAVRGLDNNIRVLDEEVICDKDFLYSIKDIIDKNKNRFKDVHEMLKTYEREDELKEKLGDTNTLAKKRNKI